jgi:long-chain acyl-CoA synthetase
VDKRREIFAEVHASFGGNLKKIICGGAALNPKMIEFFENLGISIYEGFGITECAPLTFVTPYYARKYGSVGPAVPCCTARIDVTHFNDKGYGEGEIQVKGDNVMLGYYKNPEETAKVFTEDGWFCTGDIGYMDDDGYLFITGRKKFVIVLDNGKNVFPEEIEEYLGKINGICECVVVGRKAHDGNGTTLHAIVYPQMDQFDKSMSQEDIEKSIRDAVNKLNRKLVSYKQVRGVEFRYEPFEKTTSKKIKRHLIR